MRFLSQLGEMQVPVEVESGSCAAWHDRIGIWRSWNVFEALVNEISIKFDSTTRSQDLYAFRDVV